MKMICLIALWKWKNARILGIIFTTLPALGPTFARFLSIWQGLFFTHLPAGDRTPSDSEASKRAHRTVWPHEQTSPDANPRSSESPNLLWGEITEGGRSISQWLWISRAARCEALA